MSASEVAVFFYGLFMDESLLAAKGVHPTARSIGYVDGYVLIIGNRATLVPAAEGRAHGVLMKLTPEEVEILYSDRSVADYASEPVVVTISEGTRVPAVCYNLPATKLAGTNPEYAADLLALAVRLGLPESYLGHIRSML